MPFPSAAAAWNITKEHFMDNITTLSNLRLRASYGEVGNSAISPYQTLGGLTTQTYNYGSTNTTGLYPNAAPKSPVWAGSIRQRPTWVSTSASFQNRLSGSVEFYHSYTKDMIMPVEPCLLQPVIGSRSPAATGSRTGSDF